MESNYFYLRGTEKQHVADDYAERLFIGRTQCQVGCNIL